MKVLGFTESSMTSKALIVKRGGIGRKPGLPYRGAIRAIPPKITIQALMKDA
jgi:hypothetical protein